MGERSLHVASTHAIAKTIETFEDIYHEIQHARI